MTYPYSLPELPFGYSDLEPCIDALTMEIHYTKHHQTYVNKLNEVISKYPSILNRTLEDLMGEINNLAMDENDRASLRNNGGGHLNHTLFWNILGKTKEVDADLAANIKRRFGSVDSFKKELTQTALNLFGSGWAWLVVSDDKSLEIYSTANQDSPYLRHHKPLIGIDVWEHAYYLKYQNRRAEYLESLWNVLKLI